MSETLNKMLSVLTEHDGHRVNVGGPHATAVKTVDMARTPEDLGWSYLGFSVYCLGCKKSLSRQWN